MKAFKERLVNIKIINHMLIKPYLKLKAALFFKSGNYWENRYKKGGNSGTGSYDNLAEFKANILNKFVQNKNVNTIIEFGCGDGNQLKYLNFPKYLGFDISQTIIDKTAKFYKSDNSKKFLNVNKFNNQKADLTLSLDVIYHLTENLVYEKYMEMLFNASNNYVIVYSSNFINNGEIKKDMHVKHRKFTDWIEKNCPNYKQIEFIKNKYPFNENNAKTSFADFYIFSKLNG